LLLRKLRRTPATFRLSRKAVNWLSTKSAYEHQLASARRFPMTDRAQTPRGTRETVDFSAEIRGSIIETFTTRVAISTSGMLLREANKVRIGDVVTAKLPGRGPEICLLVRRDRAGGAG
jgi:hypothetical protein